MWRLAAFRSHRDAGAMALLFAILLPVVLLGLGAVVVDVGSLYAQRGQTQNGADAAAMAVAQTCAKGSCSPSLAGPYAPSNSNGTSTVTATVTTGFPCGGNIPASVANGVSACPSGSENGSICPAAPASATVPYVDVLVNTVKSNNAADTLVPDFFGKALLGSSYNGQTIAACAQATWGPVQTCSACVPLTISYCEWSQDTNGGSTFAKLPSQNNGAYPPSYLTTIGTVADTTTTTRRRNDNAYDLTPGSIATNFYRVNTIVDPHNPPTGGGATIAGSETVLIAKSGKNGIQGFGGSDCKGGSDSSNQNGPGQFGWLAPDGSGCTAKFTANTYAGQPGANAADCYAAFLDSFTNQTPIFLPVYNAFDGSNYTLQGFAAFVVTGWDNLQAGGNFQGKQKAQASKITLNDSTLANASSYANYCDAPGSGGTTGANGASSQCVYGYFTQALIPASALPGGGGNGGGGTNLGATAPYLTG